MSTIIFQVSGGNCLGRIGALTPKRLEALLVKRLMGGEGTQAKTGGSLTAPAQRPPFSLSFAVTVDPTLLLPGATPIMEFVVPESGESILMITHDELPFWVAVNVLPGSKQKGESIAMQVKQANPDSNLRIPTVQEVREINRLLGPQLDGMEARIVTSSPNGDQERGASFYLVSAEDECLYANSPLVEGPDCMVRFVMDKAKAA